MPRLPIIWTACRVVNDTVMGGASSSSIALKADGSLRWSGTLVPEGGGFASVRCPLPAAARAALGESSSLIFSVAGGGGHTFDVRASVRGTDYRAPLVTPADGAPVNQAVRFTDMVATWRGRSVPGAPPLLAKDVDEIGFVITKGGGQRGAFSLDIVALTAADA
jgi:NADH dehydrogenase [ubiquinone] 1 alpha subcomplex assembly factor 1